MKTSLGYIVTLVVRAVDCQSRGSNPHQSRKFDSRFCSNCVSCCLTTLCYNKDEWRRPSPLFRLGTGIVRVLQAVVELASTVPHNQLTYDDCTGRRPCTALSVKR